ncbi:hypothetical protein EVAR_80998_1 [Eumeta japonica]|uniref:Uncharacterized protein n=1 Tax=Eumeta variegata TaxID=151549 RepID=A0A4C1ZV28_EUMVA|nr:hypothetical protein EVAR_80998_1 [Eumeta japonica]
MHRGEHCVAGLRLITVPILREAGGRCRLSADYAGRARSEFCQSSKDRWELCKSAARVSLERFGHRIASDSRDDFTTASERNSEFDKAKYVSRRTRPRRAYGPAGIPQRWITIVRY